MYSNIKGSIDSTVLNWAQGIEVSDDYVLFKYDDYGFCLAQGKLELGGGYITGENCTITRYYRESYYDDNSTYAKQQYIYDVVHDSIEVDVDYSPIYTNMIGSMPAIEGVESNANLQALSLAIGVLTVFLVICGIYKRLLR